MQRDFAPEVDDTATIVPQVTRDENRNARPELVAIKADKTRARIRCAELATPGTR